MIRFFRILPSLAIILTVFAVTPLFAAAGLVKTILVPLDYSKPDAGSAPLSYELGAPFDPHKPTVIVVADGQQFYVRAGQTSELQQKLFGPGLNVVGLMTRGTTPAFVQASLGPSGKADWAKAWKIFNSAQWIGDIETVRKSVVGQHQVMLYGRSGGAYLVHQYLTVHGDHVSRAFTQSPVNPVIVKALGIGLDRFWTTLGQEDPPLQPILMKVLHQRARERTTILLTLQRQHFFVPDDRLKAERARLIHALASHDDTTYAAMRSAYEVDDVQQLLSSNDSIPQNVRVLELIGPSGAFDEAGSDTTVSPLIEPQRSFAAGLIALEKTGVIPAPSFDLAALHHVATQIFVLAGRDDEAVDYRTAIALAYSYPNQMLFIANDNHNFAHLDASGEDAKLVQAFYAGGLGSAELTQALEHAAPFRWVER